MIVDINNPHSKCISLLLLALKYYFLIYLGCSILTTPHERHFSACRSTIQTFASTSSLASKILLIITSIMLIYFYCNWRFPRTEFYIYFIIHFVVCCFLAIRAIIYLGAENQGCYDGVALTQTILISAIIMNLGGVFILVMPLELAMKCLNSGGSIFWAAFWLLNRGISEKCTVGIDVNDVISLIHLLFFILSTLTFFIVKYTSKTYITAKCWRWTVFISWLAMIGCYVGVVVTDILSPNIECTFRQYFLKLYLYYGWIQILLPILLLMFVRMEKGDPRGLFYKLTAGVEYNNRVNTGLF